MTEINLKEIAKRVHRHEPSITLNQIKDYVNECLEILPMIKVQETTETASCSGTTLDLDKDIFTVQEVYVNDEKVPITLTRQDYEESTYSSNLYCYVGQDRTIYFPASLTASDTIEIVVNKINDNIDSLETSASVSLPIYYTNLFVYYILKEVYLLNDFLNYDLHVIYERKYRDFSRKVRSVFLSSPRMDFGTKL